MDKILVIGSGASGVHFALSVLKKGYQVTMLDVGKEKAKAINPGESLNNLKENLSDPVKYFLGRQYEAVTYSSSKDAYYAKYYGFPPSKSGIFSMPASFKTKTEGFAPLFSFAKGGLAEAWTGGVYPLNDDELADFPFEYRDIEPWYNEAAARIGISAEKDDLERFFPYHENIMEPLPLDQNSRSLVSAYEKKKIRLNNKLNSYLGRSRVATTTADTDERQGCIKCGRCFWGCPIESLYTPSISLRECLQYPNFDYISNVYVTHFEYDSNRHIKGVVAKSTKDESRRKFSADKYVLAAGTLSSSKIFMNSILENTGEMPKLTGLMDNRQVLIPFINLKMIGKKYNPDSYQFHQLAIGIETEKPEEYLHGQITTLKTALLHPIIQNIPLDLHMAISLFRNLRASLGIVNLNLCDRRRDESYVTLKVDELSDQPELVIKYTPTAEEKTVIKEALKKVKKMMWNLGCIVPPGMVHMREMGASVHYSGTLPMSEKPDPFTTSKNCQSHDFSNLFIVDGSTFPFLPAKNITFSLMANAIRVAETVF